ncbi:hypothetical protein BCT81_10705 [Vibrio sp. 10N.261.52.A1]|nr:hypothetical protein BCT81_10705 [Vibrio sp. 10N.261.52.A1]
MKTSYLAGISITVMCVSIAILVYDGASSNSHSSFEHKDHHPADSSHSDSHASDTHKTRQLTTSSIKVFPIPNATEIDHDLAKIGWVLFKDPNLSSNRSVSCETCHSLQTNGAEVMRLMTSFLC